MRSAALRPDILRHRLIEDSDLVPVRVRLKSTGLAAPMLIRAEPVQPIDTGVRISITSPVAAPVIHR